MIAPGSLRREALGRSRKILQSNTLWRRYRYGPDRALVHWIDNYRVTFLLLVALAYGLTAAISLVVSELSWGPSTPANVTDYFRDLQSLNLAILGAQATFIGLVFPIVIALADSLSRGRVGLSGRISIFLRETEASGTAFSCVLLLIVILIQALPISLFPDRVNAALTSINLIWAALNLALIVRFLAQAIKYLQPSNRRMMINRYVANTAWRNILTTIETRRLFVELEKSLPGGLDDDFSVFDFNRTEGTRQIFTENVLDANVVDVKPRRLKSVLHQIHKQAVKKHPAERFRNAFWIAPGDIVRPKTKLASSFPGLEISTRQQKMVTQSFVLVDELDRPSDEIEALLREYISDILVHINADDEGLFEETADEAIDLITFALAIGRSSALEGAPQSGFFSARKYSFIWIETLRRLLVRITETAVERPRVFHHACYFGYRLVARIPADIRRDTFTDALWISSFLGSQLARTIKKRVEVASRAETIDGETVGHLWADFYGAWESQIQLWADHCRSARVSHNEAFAGFDEHYGQTVSLGLKGALTGHIDSARWTADGVIKWMGAVEDFNIRHSHILIRTPSTLTISEFLADVDASIVRHSFDIDTPVPEEELYQKALENYANDGALMLMLHLIKRARLGHTTDALAASIRDLLRNDSIDPGSRGGSTRGAASVSDWFESILRIGMTWEGEGTSYHALLSKLGRSLNQIDEPPRVSMRGYSGWGGDGLPSLVQEQALLLILSACSTGSASLIGMDTSDQLATLDSQVSRDQLVRTLETLRNAIDQQTDAINEVVQTVLGTTNADIVATQKRNLIDHITSIEQRLNSDSDRAYLEAAFDQEKLDQISIWSGSKLSPENADRFPFSAFDEFLIVDSELVDDEMRHTPFTLNLNGFDFGALSVPNLSPNMIGNDADWWAQPLPEHLARPIVGQVCRELEFENVSVDNPSDLWRAISDFSQENDRTTADYYLLIPSQGNPRWLTELSWRENNIPEGVEINHVEAQPSGYLFTINDLHVFAGFSPAGEMRLLEKACFANLEFVRFGEGLVNVSAERREGDPRSADLALLTRRRVGVTQRPSLKLIFQTQAD
ncbi:hypothetical protein [Hyphobacterium sp.]|uniref:hypothetical protein n=1 Tax=Hyphobacterium sp. TaxID=2004662 RepID=UPI003BAC9F2D